MGERLNPVDPDLNNPFADGVSDADQAMDLLEDWLMDVKDKHGPDLTVDELRTLLITMGL